MSYEDYFETLEEEFQRALDVASKARKKGFDPEITVEIPPARGIAERVENLLQIPGVAHHITELSKNFNSRERVALELGLDIAMGKVAKYDSPVQALEDGVRAAVALLTEGAVSAPLEGIAKVDIGKNDDGTTFVRIYYAGPIRSAGGTAQAMSVLVADYIRRNIGINRYIPRGEEVERYVAEIPAYRQVVSLQYLPAEDEIRTIVQNCPICIDGEGTEKVSVEGFSDLERVSTPMIRGGMALVIAEGIALKARKLKKLVSMLKLDGWGFLDELVHDSTGDDTEESVSVEPRMKYMQDMLAGRPVFSHPMAKGGFRLRYGRSRNTGLAAIGVHPATMFILEEFLATGTQMKIERPGKAGAVAPVDSIDGPTVLLDDGSVLRIDTITQAKQLKNRIIKILDVGEVLISYGDFLENNHVLVPAAYCTEWWALELEQKIKERGDETLSELKNPEDIDEKRAWELCEKYGVPLHPRYTFMWHDVSCDDILFLRDFIHKFGTEPPFESDGFDRAKHILEELLVFHRLKEKTLSIEHAYTLSKVLGLEREVLPSDIESIHDPLKLVCMLSGVQIKNRAPLRIGARMGRPEKSKS
ncbi:MAG: DNA polymerase II large subunit, partial [Methermicoccaceae archaeon]